MEKFIVKSIYNGGNVVSTHRTAAAAIKRCEKQNREQRPAQVWLEVDGEMVGNIAYMDTDHWCVEQSV